MILGGEVCNIISAYAPQILPTNRKWSWHQGGALPKIRPIVTVNQTGRAGGCLRRHKWKYREATMGFKDVLSNDDGKDCYRIVKAFSSLWSTPVSQRKIDIK